MKDYLKEYKNNSVQKFQMGGQMPAPEAPAPEAAPPSPEESAAPEGEGADIEAMIAQVVETQDPNLALEVVNMIAQEAGLTSGAPAAPAEAAPAQQAAPASEGIPQGKFGMKIPVVSVKAIKK